MANLSHRMQAVQSPVIPVVGELIRRHPGTISLGQGVVHYEPPAEAIAAIDSFLSNPQNHMYKLVDGTAELLGAVEEKLETENSIRILRDRRVVITAGGNMAFYNAMLAIADPGDEVVLQSPYYFNHEMAITMLNCRPVLVPTGPDYQLDVSAIRRALTDRTRAVVTISPNNPSGAVYTREALTEVNALCCKRKIYHISDEAYENFIYDGAQHFSPGSLPDSTDYTISLFSLSKAYGMASWRVGYMVVPERLLLAIKKAQDTILICPPVISQWAACGALRAGAEFWRPRIEALGQVRHMVLEELAAVQDICAVPPATGAFYFLLRLESHLTSMEVVEKLVRDFGVALIPGSTFGAEGCQLRLAYGALDRDSVAQGVGRLVRGLRAIIKRP